MVLTEDNGGPEPDGLGGADGPGGSGTVAPRPGVGLRLLGLLIERTVLIERVLPPDERASAALATSHDNATSRRAETRFRMVRCLFLARAALRDHERGGGGFVGLPQRCNARAAVGFLHLLLARAAPTPTGSSAL